MSREGRVFVAVGVDDLLERRQGLVLFDARYRSFINFVTETPPLKLVGDLGFDAQLRRRRVRREGRDGPHRLPILGFEGPGRAAVDGAAQDRAFRKRVDAEDVAVPRGQSRERFPKRPAAGEAFVGPRVIIARVIAGLHGGEDLPVDAHAIAVLVLVVAQVALAVTEGVRPLEVPQGVRDEEAGLLRRQRGVESPAASALLPGGEERGVPADVEEAAALLPPKRDIAEASNCCQVHNIDAGVARDAQEAAHEARWEKDQQLSDNDTLIIAGSA